MGTARKNNVGALRLVLAALVVLGHAPEMLDGDRSREPLTWLTGQLSLPDLAVDGFFILSGWLITASFLRSTDGYLWRRALRIVPGFAVAFVGSLVVALAFAGGQLPLERTPQLIGRLLTLNGPEVDGAFAGLPQHMVNAPMWTISYEFRCYLLVALLGYAGALNRRAFVLAGVAVLVLLNPIAFGVQTPAPWHRLVGVLEPTIRLVGMFGAGAVLYLYRKEMPLTRWGAATSAVGLTALLFTPLAEVGVATFGAYLLLWVAFQRWPGAELADETDMSYGVYLYAWPIANLMVLASPGMSPWVLGPLSLGASMVVALASWRLIERPALRYAAISAAQSTVRRSQSSLAGSLNGPRS